MNIRFFGGPNHNKTLALPNPTRIIEIVRPKPMYGLSLNSYDPSPVLAATSILKSGRYYQTDERDKHGNTIYAWSGWR